MTTKTKKKKRTNSNSGAKATTSKKIPRATKTYEAGTVMVMPDAGATPLYKALAGKTVRTLDPVDADHGIVRVGIPVRLSGIPESVSIEAKRLEPASEAAAAEHAAVEQNKGKAPYWSPFEEVAFANIAGLQVKIQDLEGKAGHLNNLLADASNAGRELQAKLDAEELRTERLDRELQEVFSDSEEICKRLDDKCGQAMEHLRNTFAASKFLSESQNTAIEKLRGQGRKEDRVSELAKIIGANLGAAAAAPIGAAAAKSPVEALDKIAKIFGGR